MAGAIALILMTSHSTLAATTTAPAKRSGDLLIETVSPAELSAPDRAAWDGLFESQHGPANPFCAPEWVLGWYSAFTVAEDQLLLFIRSGERLVGVAPFFRSRVRVGGATLIGRLQLAGAGQGGSLLELPQVLAAPGLERAVLRLVVAETMLNKELTGSGLWAEIQIPRSQGWFEPEWAARTGHPVSFQRQVGSQACVMLPLAGSWEATKSGLKRNVKESLRRSRNRLAKDGRPWSVQRRTVDLDEAVVDRFLGLHQRRAEQKVANRHGDAFADPARRQFLRSLLPALGSRQRASILELTLDGEVVASQLVLHAPQLTYIHSSGFRADVWDLGPVTFLQGIAISDAADRGEDWINLSPGPNVAKLRWSEQVDVYDDFSYGSGGRWLHLRYAAFSVAQTLSKVAHAVRVNRLPPEQ
jgi:CelD/BcsL family acetyltransferase involved in cellulose biosynthesis